MSSSRFAFALALAAKCPYTCGDNACVGDGPTDACIQCITDTCAEEFNTCANDA